MLHNGYNVLTEIVTVIAKGASKASLLLLQHMQADSYR